MNRLEFRHTPKSELKSPVRRAIMDWLREHGPATRTQVQAAMDERGFITVHISDDVYALRKKGHLERQKPACGGELLFYVAGSDASAEPAPAMDAQHKLKCPVKRAIIKWMREHGPARAVQLRDAMLESGATSWLMLDQSTRYWAEDHCYELYISGHLRRERNDGELFYSVADAKADELAASSDALDAPEVVPCTIAAPRRIDVLRAPALTGGDTPPARKGAMDYAAIPSLMNGRRVPRHTGRAAS